MARKPSAAAHRKALEAAIDLVAERGVEGTSMDAIAERSGVSKATIYKHWQDKEALLLDVMAEVHGLSRRPAFDSGDTKADIKAVLGYRPSEMAAVRDRIMPHFLAYSARNQKFGDAWRRVVMNPPHMELTRLLKSGIAKGELPKTLDLDLSFAFLIGPIIYSKIFLKRADKDPAKLADSVVDAFWRAFATANSSGAKSVTEVLGYVRREETISRAAPRQSSPDAQKAIR